MTQESSTKFSGGVCEEMETENLQAIMGRFYSAVSWRNE